MIKLFLGAVGQVSAEVAEAAARGAWPSGPAELTRLPRRHRLAGGGLPTDRGLGPGGYLSRGMKIGATGDAPRAVGQEHWTHEAGMVPATGEQ